MNKARKKILKDLVEQRDDTKRMRKHKRLIWKLRGWFSWVEYWIVAFGFPISLLIWIFTQDFWKAIVFYGITLIYHFSGSLRGLTLHLENYIEWAIEKQYDS